MGRRGVVWTNAGWSAPSPITPHAIRRQTLAPTGARVFFFCDGCQAGPAIILLVLLSWQSSPKAREHAPSLDRHCSDLLVVNSISWDNTLSTYCLHSRATGKAT